MDRNEMPPYLMSNGEVYGEPPPPPMPRIRSRVPKAAPPETSSQRLAKAAARASERRQYRERIDPRWAERSPESQRLLLKQDAAEARERR